MVRDATRLPTAIDGVLKSLVSSTGTLLAVQLASASRPVQHRKPSQSSKSEPNTSPGSAALFGCTWPAPWRKITTGSVLAPSSTSYALVINADLMAIGDHLGCT